MKKDEVFKKEQQLGRLEDAGEFPKVILIDTVSFCNLRCSMCFHHKMTREKAFMPWGLYKKIIDEIAITDKSVRIWNVFFGEPFVKINAKPTIFEMIRYAKDQGLTDVVLNSNAGLMTKDVSEKVILSGLDAIYIGIDAFSSDTYSRIRVGGKYEETVQNVQYLIDAKKRLNSPTPEINVQFVEMDINTHEKEAFSEYWNGKGVKVKIRPKVSWAGKVSAPNLVLGNEERWPCYWAMRTMSILESGQVALCAVDLDGGFDGGNINSMTIKEAWNGLLKENRQKHADKRFNELPKMCAECRDWQSARAEYYNNEGSQKK
jgi:MoaA/NifB/PqqE/SkfB family radical SAM enzyme